MVYKAEKDACRAFPDPQGDGLAAGPKRNFQVLSPLEFLAEFTQHIPPKGAHLRRDCGTAACGALQCRGRRPPKTLRSTARTTLARSPGN